jgi:transcriptional regulator with XRE-family HTH domain
MIAENLKTLRRSKNWAQVKTAKNLKIKLCRYQSYEESRAEPNIELLIKIADMYKITVDMLIRTKLKIEIRD